MQRGEKNPQLINLVNLKATCCDVVLGQGKESIKFVRPCLHDFIHRRLGGEP